MLLCIDIGNTNIVKMSSIVPPHCVRIEPRVIAPGTLIATAFAEITSTLHGETYRQAVAEGRTIRMHRPMAGDQPVAAENLPLLVT